MGERPIAHVLPLPQLVNTGTQSGRASQHKVDNFPSRGGSFDHSFKSSRDQRQSANGRHFARSTHYGSLSSGFSVHVLGTVFEVERVWDKVTKSNNCL
jgi:hypothetical protein